MARRNPSPVAEGDWFGDAVKSFFELGTRQAYILTSANPGKFSAVEREQLARIERSTNKHAGMVGALNGTFLIGASLAAASTCRSEGLSGDTLHIAMGHGARGQHSLIQGLLQLPPKERRRVFDAITENLWRGNCEGAMAAARIAHFLQDNDLPTYLPTPAENLYGVGLITLETPRFFGTVIQVRAHHCNRIIVATEPGGALAKGIIDATEKFNRFYEKNFKPVLVFVDTKSANPGLEYIRDCVELFAAVRQLRKRLMKTPPHT